MPRRLGPLLGLFAQRFLDGIPFPADHRARIAARVADGAIVVWVHRARNPMETLALARAVQRDGLPRARFVGGLNVVGLQPFWALPTWLRGGVGTIEANARRDEELLDTCVRAGLPAEIFLRRPLTLLSTHSAYRARFIEVLVRAQRTLDRPILLVPLFLALRQRPGNFEPTPLDAVFGTVEEPGLLRAIGRVIGAGAQARFEVSDPVDLRAFIHEHPDREDHVLAKKVRWSLLHHLARVERLCHGPPLKSPTRMREDLKRDPQLVASVATLARETGLPPAALERRVERLHDEIAARPDVDVARIFSRILDVVWRRIYEGIHVDEDGVRRLRDAGKRGPLVLVPSHRSHIDYLVLSQVMLKRGLLPPLVAAGDNLSFFPMGALFRRGGAFFLRRSMKGDPFYVTVFKAYVRRVFAEGFSLEFFIEGGRSRTGKTLPPKLGLLSMVVDAFLESRERDALFVPCHISYEHVIEAGAYAGELGGKAKTKESARALLGAASVLKNRYGRVYVSFDEPISLAEHLAVRGVQKPATHAPAEGPALEARRGAVQTLGHRIVYGINRAGVITATALVSASWIGFRRSGVDEEVLLGGALALLGHVRARASAARLQPGLSDDATPPLRAALDRLIADGALARSVAGTRTLISMRDGAALELDAQKNQLLHHVVPECILAVALSVAGAAPGVPAERHAVKDAARALSRVLKLEVIFRFGATFDQLFDEAVRVSATAGLLALSADGSQLGFPAADAGRTARRFARNMLLGLLETYFAVTRAAALHLDGGLDEKTFIARALLDIQGQVLAGELATPAAANKVTVENAVALLLELRALGTVGSRLVVEDGSVFASITELLRRARPRAR